MIDSVWSNAWLVMYGVRMLLYRGDIYTVIDNVWSKAWLVMYAVGMVLYER